MVVTGKAENLIGIAESASEGEASSEEILARPYLRRDEKDFLSALFSFNMGIEFGQIAVIGIAFAATALWWKRDFYRLQVARPASAMIAVSGLYWAVERSFLTS